MLQKYGVNAIKGVFYQLFVMVNYDYKIKILSVHIRFAGNILQIMKEIYNEDIFRYPYTLQIKCYSLHHRE
jgi:hypothetical protein